MGQLNDRLRGVVGCHFAFFCPGCKEMHHVGTGWTFDGNLAAPTISPSLLVTSGHHCPSFKPGHDCWCTHNAWNPSEPVTFKCERCHTFVRGGNIEFLADCTHELAGKTVPIPALPPGYRDP